jgi:hypothetical protein
MSRTIRSVFVRSLSLGSALALCLIFSALGFAQSDNTQISGFVKGPVRSGHRRAKVSVKNETNGLERTAMTNGEGYYIVTSSRPGFIP